VQLTKQDRERREIGFILGSKIEPSLRDLSVL